MGLVCCTFCEKKCQIHYNDIKSTLCYVSIPALPDQMILFVTLYNKNLFIKVSLCISKHYLTIMLGVNRHFYELVCITKCYI